MVPLLHRLWQVSASLGDPTSESVRTNEAGCRDNKFEHRLGATAKDQRRPAAVTRRRGRLRYVAPQSQRD